MHELAQAKWVPKAFCVRSEHFEDSPWVSNTKEDRETAVNLCLDHCTVLSDCLSYALRHGEEDGVWGGATPEYRKVLRLRMIEG